MRGLDSLVYNEIPDPEPKAGDVVIEIKAFGINHAERWSSSTADLPPIDNYGRHEM